jgi:hypothetical protein
MSNHSQEGNGDMMMTEAVDKTTQHDSAEEIDSSDGEHPQQGVENILACFRNQQDEMLQKIAVSQETFEQKIETSIASGLESITTIRFGPQAREYYEDTQKERNDLRMDMKHTVENAIIDTSKHTRELLMTQHESHAGDQSEITDLIMQERQEMNHVLKTQCDNVTGAITNMTEQLESSHKQMNHTITSAIQQLTEHISDLSRS